MFKFLRFPSFDVQVSPFSLSGFTFFRYVLSTLRSRVDVPFPCRGSTSFRLLTFPFRRSSRFDVEVPFQFRPSVPRLRFNALTSCINVSTFLEVQRPFTSRRRRYVPVSTLRSTVEVRRYVPVLTFLEVQRPFTFRRRRYVPVSTLRSTVEVRRYVPVSTFRSLVEVQRPFDVFH
jgi:hypothetical protein